MTGVGDARVVRCEYNGQPHPIDEECVNVVDVPPPLHAAGDGPPPGPALVIDVVPAAPAGDAQAAPGRRRIHVVSAGEYSGYSVLCAFEREEDAHTAVQAGFGDEVEEMVLFAPGALPNRTVTCWVATAWAGGVYDSPPVATPIDHTDWDEPDPKPPEVFTGRPQVQTTDRGHFGTAISVKAASRDEALKVASDWYAKRRAELAGL